MGEPHHEAAGLAAAGGSAICCGKRGRGIMSPCSQQQRRTVKDWKFQDSPDTAVIADRNVVEGKRWIALVSHDEDDGGWQFLSNVPVAVEDAAVVSLKNIVALDPTLVDLADLPIGWQAWRASPISQWQRKEPSSDT